ncbi:MAG: biopolymer transporter ExbD [Phycisphaerales bacterium]
MSAPRHVYRRRNAQSLYAMHYGPNMTPMVDVVMVILIFFMASAVVLGPEWFVRTNLPKPDTASTQRPGSQPLRLAAHITREGDTTSVQFNDDAPVSLEVALKALRPAMQDRPADEVVMLIRPDADVPYEDVVRLHAACQELGITRVGLVDR